MVSTATIRRGSRPILITVALIAVIAILVALAITLRPAPASAPKTTAFEASLGPYRTMTLSDLDKVLGAQSDHCGTVTDTGCPAAADRVNTQLKAWRADLDAATVPAIFAVINLVLRRHVALAIDDLDGLVAAYERHDDQAMSASLSAAVGERDQIELEVGAIQSSHASNASDYRAEMRIDAQLVSSCASCLSPAGVVENACAGAQRAGCMDEINATRSLLEQFQATLVANRAPASLAAADGALQSDLYVADLSLGNAASSLVAGDATELEFANGAYLQARLKLTQDVAGALEP